MDSSPNCWASIWRKRRMKTGLAVLALGGALVMGSYSVQAADLINEDDAPYTVIVDNEQEVNVGPAGDVMGICKSCTLQLADSNEPAITVMEDTTVMISNAKLVVEN